MHSIYVLFSLRDKQFYTGDTEDLEARVMDRFKGKVDSTRTRRPLQLMYYEACLERADALHRERYLKTTWGKRYLRNRLRKSLELLKV